MTPERIARGQYRLHSGGAPRIRQGSDLGARLDAASDSATISHNEQAARPAAA